MNTILLTGAGFSHNWGGRLAREFNTTVALRLQNDPYLADLLHRNPNFEEALTELQNEAATSARPGVAERLQRLETAIVDAFAEMNRNLGMASFNFCADLRYALPEFLILFDAIFTLNQDLLIEKHYLYPREIVSIAGTRKWLGGYLPATDELPDPGRTGLYDPLRVQRPPTLFQIARINELEGSERPQSIGNGRQQADHNAAAPHPHLVRRKVSRAPLETGGSSDGDRLRLQG